MILPIVRPWLAPTSRRLMLAALVAVGLGGVPPGALRAQSLPTVAQLRLEYQEAASTLEAAVAAFEVVESRFNQAIDELTVAKESGDEGRLDRAYASAQAAAPAIRVAEARVREKNEEAEEARARLGEGLEAELDRLYSAEDTVPIEGLADLRITIVDMENELDEVRGSFVGFAVQPAILVQLRIDPTDGPNDILNKADLLERRAARHTANLSEIDGRLEELRKRQRLQRARNTALAGVRRFDDSRVPVGPPGQGSSQTPPGGVVEPAETIEEQIRGLEQVRERLVELRDEIIERAGQFRVRAGGKG
ncbi:MAG: hypothetical protein BMS9Abin29_1283 [Gemmatimonadota bacterium]|nr:MAG: hypothetical protein BMS9Abin29_1283 [Gemmatimonadota bacterium]